VIVVDTSVWVSALRDARSPSAATLAALLDADEAALALPVRVELMAGVSERDRRPLSLALAGLPVVRPIDDTWSIVEQWTGVAARAGYRFGLTDLLIAALAHETGALVWSLDADFGNMSGIGLVGLYA
jgi:predicted nucleic acid-binding protein